MSALWTKASAVSATGGGAQGPRLFDGKRARHIKALRSIGAQVLVGDRFPFLGHCGLQRHAPSRGELEMFGRAVVEPDFVRQPIEQRIYTAHPSDFVILERTFEVA